LISALIAAPTWAEGPGQEDLDQATQDKINAATPNDLTKVVGLLQSALDKGLDDENEKFAEQLLVSTLLERAELLARLIFEQSPPDERWPQIRQVILTDVERALAIDENQPQGNFLKGRLLALSGGDREGAIEAFGKVIDAPEEAVEPATRAEALVYRANLSGDAEKQLADYDRAVELRPASAEIVRSRGMFHLRNERVEEAIADFRKAIELEPDSADTHEVLGLALIAEENLDEALAEFQKAADLAPDDVSPLINQARVLGGKRQYQEALAALDKALKVDPQSLSVLMFRAQVHIQNEDAERALDDLDEVLRLSPGRSEAVWLKAGILRQEDRLAEAVRVLQEGVESSPDNVGLLTQLGFFQLIDENYNEAIGAFSKVLEIDSENVEALRGRSDSYLSIGEHAPAIEDYERALAIAPDDSTVLNNLAWVLCTSPIDELRNGQRALELAVRACEVTEYAQAHILSTLAAAHAELGDFEKAREWSTKAIEVEKEHLAEEEDAEQTDPEQLKQLEAELASYQQQKPWRERQEKQKKPADAVSNVPDPIEPAPAATSEF
jgi:tetratricopeptide (TPR) repeat protein